jgi:hypothetical protein
LQAPFIFRIVPIWVFENEPQWKKPLQAALALHVPKVCPSRGQTFDQDNLSSPRDGEVRDGALSAPNTNPVAEHIPSVHFKVLHGS